MKKRVLFLILNIGMSYFVLGQSVLWTSAVGSAWLSGTNWNTGTVPSGIQIAQFSTNPTTNPAPIGIYINGTTPQQVGAIEILPTRPNDISIGNSGTNKHGYLQLDGMTVNNIPHVILRNNSNRLFTLLDNQGTTGSTLGIMLGDVTNNVITIDGSGGITISSAISGTNRNLTLAGTGSGILIFQNAGNVYSGTTTITHGELRMNPDFSNTVFSSKIILKSGTLSTTNITASVVITSSSTLKVDSTSSKIVLGSNVHSLKFAASDTVNWGGATLTITGWVGAAGSSGTAGKLFVGSNASGLTLEQLAKICFSGFAAGAQMLSTGEVVPAVVYIPPIYYSKGSLAPNLTTSWNSNRNGSSGKTPVNFKGGATFMIQNGHSMTTSGTWSISGTSSKLEIESGGTLNAVDAITLSSGTTFQIDNGGTYIHNNTAAVLLFSGVENFSANSLVEIKNWVSSSTAIPAITGSWGNLKITYNPGAAWTQSGNITNIAGNFTIDNSSSNAFSFAGDAGLTLTVNGDVNINSGLLCFSNAGSTTNTFVLNLGGSYSQTGGIFMPNVNASSTLSINFSGSNKTFTQSGGTLLNTQINWTIKSGASNILNTNLPVASGRTFTINGELDCGTNSVSGAGSFTLLGGATLKTSNTSGIDGSISVSGIKSLSTSANFYFYGNSQQVTGVLLPAVVNNLTIDNSADLKLSNAALTIKGTLLINAGKQFILESGKQVTVSGSTLLNGSQCLILKSDASGTASFIDHGITGSGTSTVERYLSPDAWHYISSPISNAHANTFFGDYLKTSDPSTTTGWSGWIVDPSTPLQVMQGYACWKPSGNSTFEEFTGNLNNGDQTLIVDNNGTGTYAHWHLVGNPFPSAVDLNAGISWGNFEHAVYFWNQNHSNSVPYTGGGNYDVYPQSGGWGTHDQYVPSSQGFYLYDPSGNTTFSIPNSARVHSSIVFLKQAKLISNGLIISVTCNSNNYSDKISIHFNPKTTLGYDPGYDAYKLWGLHEAPQLYTRIGDTNVTCNSLPFDKQNMAIAMGFRCGINGQYILKADSIGTFGINISIILEDLKLNTTSDFRVHPTYTFIYDTLDDANRFVLHFTDQSFGLNDLNKSQRVQIYSFGNAIYIKFQDRILPEGTIFVYDLIGKKIFQGKLMSQSLNRFVPNVNDGLYFVMVVSKERAYSGKVFLEKN
jgi:hypothetical protein